MQNEYDTAIIRFNIPRGTYIPDHMHACAINNILQRISNIISKPNIKFELTSNDFSEKELIQWCSMNTINCFLYNRQHIFKSGLAAVTDQAIASGRPLLISDDCTFRHIHKYINSYPNIGIREAINTTIDGVNKMKEDWKESNFLLMFEEIIDHNKT